MKIRLWNKEYLLCPKKSITYFILFVFSIVLLSVIIETVVLRPLKSAGVTGYSEKWDHENALININNLEKRGFKITNNIPQNCLWPPNAHSTNPNKIIKIPFCTTLFLDSHNYTFYKKDFANDFIWINRVYKVSPQKIARKRILVIGDSYTWGDGYANMNDIWWRKLQRELVKRGYYDVEVIAIGWNDTSTKDEFEHLKLTIRTYNPDIVIWGYVTNDPDERMIKIQNTDDYELMKDNINYGIIKNPDKILKFLNKFSILYPNFSKHLFRARLGKLSKYINNYNNPEVVYGYDNWEIALLKGKNYEKYNQTLHEINLFSKKNKDIPIFFVTLPNKPLLYRYSPKYNKVLEAFNSNKIKMYNLLPELLYEFPFCLWGQQWDINLANPHPGAIPTDFYARQVSNILENDYPKYLPQKYTGHVPKEPLINDWVPMNINLTQNGPISNFTYPVDVSNCLSMPYGYKYIQLNLSYPLKVKKIIIEGKDLLSARLDITYENPLDQTVYQLGLKKGKELVWNNFTYTEKLNTIRINANFANGIDRNLKLKIIQ